MNVQCFTVFDSAARRFLEPFHAETVEVALRMFRTLVEKENHQFNRFPEDYTLFHIGEFDAVTGKYLPIEPVSLGVAVMFQKAPSLKKVK